MDRGTNELPSSVLDERLDAVLRGMTSDELRRLQTELYETLRIRLPSVEQIAKGVESQSNGVASWLRARETGDESIKPVMLLGAVAVAIAWWTHRSRPAPAFDLQQVIGGVAAGESYLLPIPRCDPCFCGSATKFKCCHGRPPNAVPLMTA